MTELNWTRTEMSIYQSYLNAWTRETSSDSCESYVLAIDDNKQVKLTKYKLNK